MFIGTVLPIEHVPSPGLKPLPPTTTVEPTGPPTTVLGVRVILGEYGFTVNVEEAESPPLPVTVIVYLPVGGLATAVNEALTVPLSGIVIVQDELAINPPGVLVTPQAESAV